jgi:hypothetical protein
MNIHQWQNQVKKFNLDFDQDPSTREQWNENIKANLPRFKKELSIWNLEWLFYKKEKAMVVVGASPSLKKDVEKLKKLDDRFCIICANSSLKYLINHGVIPDYCISIDSDDIDIPQHLDIDRDDVTLLASTVTCGEALDKWKGPIYYVPYYSVDKDIKAKVKRILGKGVPSGGNSMTEAMYIGTMIFGSRTLMFVGCEYCFDSVKDYYADDEASKQEKMLIRYPIVDVLGKDRWTQPAHFLYSQWTEKIAADLSPPGYFIDTSFGILGRDRGSVIKVMELSEAIAIVKRALDDAKRLNEAKTDKAKQKILKELTPKDDNDKVHRYNLQEHRERILQFARS